MRVSRMNVSLMWLQLPLLVIFTALSFACGGPPTQQGTTQDGTGIPELSEDTIRERINGVRVRDVKEENGAGEPISWTFWDDEPKEITVVDKQVDGAHAVVVLDVTTTTSANARNPRRVYGQFRSEWQLETGWVLRRWEVQRTENISMKYQNLPKPDNQNSNSNSNQNSNSTSNKSSNSNRDH